MTNWLTKEKRDMCKYLFAGQIANGVDKDKSLDVAIEITNKIFEQYSDEGYGENASPSSAITGTKEIPF